MLIVSFEESGPAVVNGRCGHDRAKAADIQGEVVDRPVTYSHSDSWIIQRIWMRDQGPERRPRLGLTPQPL